MYLVAISPLLSVAWGISKHLKFKVNTKYSIYAWQNEVMKRGSSPTPTYSFANKVSKTIIETRSWFRLQTSSSSYDTDTLIQTSKGPQIQPCNQSNWYLQKPFKFYHVQHPKCISSTPCPRASIL